MNPQRSGMGWKLILVCAVGTVAGAVQRARRSAGDHLRAAGSQASRFQATQTTEPSTLTTHANKKTTYRRE